MSKKLVMIAKKLTMIALLCWSFSGALIAGNTSPEEDAAARDCLPILQNNAVRQTPPKSAKNALDRCAAVHACQNPLLADVPQCALKLNTWVFTLNVPEPGDGSTLKSAPPPAGSGAGGPLFRAPSPPPAPEAETPKNEDVSWF